VRQIPAKSVVRLLSVLCAGILLNCLSSPCASAAAPGIATGAPEFSVVQADLGRALYVSKCASCHGSSLEGGAGPALVGEAILAKWSQDGKTVANLHFVIKNTMPMGAPGSLTDDQYVDVVAYILLSNHIPAGAAPLEESNMNVVLKGGMAATGLARVRPATPAAQMVAIKATTAIPDDREIASPDEADWLMYNKSLDGQRYSKLDQITARNARNLIVSCIFQFGELGSFQSAPIVYDGMMYVTTPFNTFALNPKTCEKIWMHAYPPDNSMSVKINRGVSIYRGKLFRVTPNDHVLAIDAKTGKLLWDVLLADKDHGYWMSAAPIAYEGRVFIGEAGADWGANGHIYGLDAETGRVDWTFDVIPTGDQFGADTWGAGAQRGGGSMWTTYTLVSETGLLYASVGNPAPSFNGAMRPGANLFTDSVVVLNSHTGKLAWYVQQTPHDVHDWDTAAAPVVYDRGAKAFLAVATKSGWLFIYDRATHKLLSKTEVSPQENVDMPMSTAGVHHCPGILGGVQWNGPAYSPRDGLLFVNSVNWCGTSRLAEDRYEEGSSYLDGSHTWDPIESARGWTKAFDAVTGKLVWSRETGAPMVAALTPTASGVVFTGELSGKFTVLSAKNGEILYQFNTGGAVAGAASTYLIDGKQYIAVTTGNASRSVWKTTGAMTLLVFSLPETR